MATTFDSFWNNLPRPILALAPMAGVCDSAFKQMCRRGGADVVYTEFVSADALAYNGKKTIAMLKFSEAERPTVCQIFGKKPEHFVRAAKIVEELGYDGIDINFGCPAYKVVKHGGGVTLMRQPKLCAELVQAVTDNTKLPVSVKIRASIKMEGLLQITALDLLPYLLKFPMSTIMLHARSYEQAFDGIPNWPLARQVGELIKNKNPQIIFLVNGGIIDGPTAAEALIKTGADGLGIARATMGHPWIFSEIKSYLKGTSMPPKTLPEIKELALIHAKLALESKGSYGLIELRKHMTWYLKGFSGASILRAKLMQTKELAEIEQIFQETPTN